MIYICISRLHINSMRSERLQFNLLRIVGRRIQISIQRHVYM